MAEGFSLFVPRDSGFHRLHPLTKITLTFLLLVAGLTSPGLWTTYGLFVFVVLPLSAWATLLGELVRAILRVIVPFAISIFLIQGFLWPGGTPLYGFGPISLKREGLAFAIAGNGRILMVVSSFLLFALTTRPDSLMTALVQRGFPSSLAYIIVTTIQMVPRFQARTAAILDAQRARGLETEGRLPQRLRALMPLVVPLILSSLLDVEERAIAIEARAFNRPGPKTSFLRLQEAGWERFARWSMLAAMPVLIGLRIALELR